VFSGALPRFVRRPSVWLAAAAGAGLGAMFSCRPFEAVVLGVCSIPVPWLLRSKAGLTSRLVHALPGCAVFALVVGGVAVHNAALTGSPVRFGYDLNMERHGYGVFPGSRTVGTEPDATPHLAAFYEDTRRYAAYGWTLGGFLGTRLRNLGWSWVFLIGPILTLGCLHWPRSLRVGRLRPALPGLLSFWVVAALNPWPFPHYFAGALGFLLVFALTGLRLWCVHHRAPVPLVLGSMLVAATSIVVVRGLGGAALVSAQTGASEWLPYHTPRGLDERRTLAETVSRHGPALVFVRYGPSESVRRDWVYNDPDPTRARVVWVNDLGPDDNARTNRTYEGRRPYCVEIVAGHPRGADCTSWISPRPHHP
jgi:hypothetical protein